MVDEIEPISQAGYYDEGQGLGATRINEAIDRLAQLFPLVQDRDLNDADSATETNGFSYVVAAGVAPGDAWEGHEGDIATYRDGWEFRTPTEGDMIRILDEKLVTVFNSVGAFETIFGWT